MLGHPDTDRQRHFEVPHVFDPLAQPLGDASGVELVAAWQQRHELFAAEATADIHGAQTVLNSARDEPQRAVAGVVAEPVVDRLEMIRVDVKRRERLAGALGAMNEAPAELEHAASARELSEVIDVREGAQLHLEAKVFLLRTQSEEIRHEARQNGDEEREHDAEPLGGRRFAQCHQRRWSSRGKRRRHRKIPAAQENRAERERNEDEGGQNGRGVFAAEHGMHDNARFQRRDERERGKARARPAARRPRHGERNSH